MVFYTHLQIANFIVLYRVKPDSALTIKKGPGAK